MLKRLYRIVIVIVCTAMVLGLAAAIYFNFYLNRLEVTNLFLDFSTFVLLLFLLVLILRYTVLLWFAYLHNVEKLTEPPPLTTNPRITVIVPAYNEGPVIEAALRSLMQLEYPNYDILVVDDGSSDDTYARALRVSKSVGGEKIKLLTQPNGGKARALNNGIAHATGELILCMDGDSRLDPQTLKWAVRHFGDPAVGAVAGNVKVVNRLNLLTRLQALEYIEGLNLVRTAQAFFQRLTVIPGPVGLFRKKMLRELGGYLPDTYAEDCELTLRIVFAGWKIKYEERAIAWTEAPEKSQALFKQRYRWSRGILQAIIKHKHKLLHPHKNFLDWSLLSLLVFESMVLPAMNVFGIFFFAFAAMWGGLSHLTFLWWAQLTILDAAAALFCVAAEREDIKLVIYALPYRLYFIPFVDVIRFFASIDELYGVEMGWGRLQRFGRI